MAIGMAMTGTYKDGPKRWREAFVRKNTRLARRIGEILYVNVSDGGKYGPGTPIAEPETWQHPVPGYIGGKHRASWRAGIDQVPAWRSPGAKVEGGTPAVLAAITDADMQVLAVLNRLRPGQALVVVNDGQAFPRLEFTGWSPQAPSGIMRPVLESIQAIVDEAVEAVVGEGEAR